MALSVRQEEFQVHPAVEPGKAVLCCGFLETVVYSTQRTFGGINTNLTRRLSIYTEITGQKWFFLQECGSGIADRLAEDFQAIDFLDCRLVLLSLSTIIS